MGKGFLILVFLFLVVFVSAADCSIGEITSECQCGNTNASVGLCCDAGSEMIWFDPYYENLGGCPSGTYYYVDKNNPLASDSNSGTSPSSPWLTVKKATDTLHAGDVALVKSGSYSTTGGSWELPAYNPAYSGTVDNPIIFRSYPNSDVTMSAVYSVIGSRSRDYVVWDGFKVDSTCHCDGGFPITIINSVRFDLTSDYNTFDFTEGVVIMNNEVMGIGYVNTADNYNGIRVDYGAKNLVIRNNIVYGYFGDTHNSACIQFYQLVNSTVENNELYNCTVGIYMKGGPSFFNKIRYNYIHHTTQGIYDGYHGIPDTQYNFEEMYQNIIADCVSGGEDNLGINMMSYHVKKLDHQVYNNVIYNCGMGLKITTDSETDSYDNLDVHNNIFMNTPSAIDAESGARLIYNFSSNYNNFYNYNNFIIGWSSIGGLSNWRSQTGHDLNSTEIDPQFVDPGNDFHLQSGSSMRTLGMDLQDYDNDGDTTERIPAGAYITGEEVIGLVNSSVISWNPPEPPPANSADVNSDGVVDIRDLALSVYWQGKDDTNEPNWGWFSHLDLNGDGRINWGDVWEIISKI